MTARLRALLRIEWRHLVRAPLRSLLIVLLLAVPVAAVVGGSVLLFVALPTRTEQIREQLGGADRRVDGRAQRLVQAAAALPEDVAVHWQTFRPARIRVRGLALSAMWFAFDPKGPVAGRYRLMDGRAPAGPGEVAVSPAVRTAAGLALGDPIEAVGATPQTVVGVLADPERLEDPFVVEAAGSPPETAGDRSTGAAMFLELGAADADEVDAALRALGSGLSILGPDRAAQSMEGVGQAVLVFGSLGFVEAALVVAAAFVIGLRRRQREIGLVASVGARGRDIIHGVLASAAILALLGSLLGVGVGLGIAAWLHPRLDGWAARMTGPFEVPWGVVGGACVLALLTSVLAALWPARSAARLPVMAALSGRRPPRGSLGSRWLALGLVLVALGAGATCCVPFLRDGAVVVAGIAGAVLGVLGFGACSPWLLERLGRYAARLPVPWRLAVRDASRFRSRNGPVVTAVLAGMAVSVTIAAVLASIEATSGSTKPSLGPDVLRFQGTGAAAAAERAAEELGARAIANLQCAYRDGQPVRAIWIDERSQALGDFVGWLAVADGDLFDALGCGTSSEIARASASGGLLSLDPIPEGARGAHLRSPRAEGAPIGTVWSVRPVSSPPGLSRPRMAMPRTALASHGLVAGPWPSSGDTWLVRLDCVVDDAALERARELAAAFPGTGVDAALLLRRLPQTLYRVALLLSVLSGLLVLGVATALTAVESRGDRETLASLGASPRMRRAHAAAATGYLALLGCSLSIPAGLLPAFGLVTGIGGLAFRVPWWELAVTAVGLPVLAYALAWLVAHPRRVLRAATAS